MNYADIKRNDAANGPGIRISLFVSGCSHHCKGCFNEAAWDYNYGNPFTGKEEDLIMQLLEPSYITGLTVLGGEPMDPHNQPAVLSLLKKVRDKYMDSKSIWVYTGYLFDKDIMERMIPSNPVTSELVSLVDIIMDGPYIEELKDMNLYFRGSSNQRAVDVPATLANNGKMVLWEPYRPKYVYPPK